MAAESIMHLGHFGRISFLRMGNALVTHAHPQAHLIIKLAGADLRFEVAGESCVLVRGQALLINSWEPHAYCHLEGAEAPSVFATYLEPDWLARACGDRRIAFSKRLVPIAMEQEAALGQLRDALRDRALRSQDAIEAALTALVQSLSGSQALLPDQEQRPRIGDHRIRRSLTLLEENFEEFRSMAAVARLSGLSRDHFFALFKQHTQLTPHVYFNMCRMEAAIRGLVRTDMRILDIATELGFSAQSNFTRFFKEHAGVSPRDFRRARLAENGLRRGFYQRHAPLIEMSSSDLLTPRLAVPRAG